MSCSCPVVVLCRGRPGSSQGAAREARERPGSSQGGGERAGPPRFNTPPPMEPSSVLARIGPQVHPKRLPRHPKEPQVQPKKPKDTPKGPPRHPKEPKKDSKGPPITYGPIPGQSRGHRANPGTTLPPRGSLVSGWTTNWLQKKMICVHVGAAARHLHQTKIQT